MRNRSNGSPDATRAVDWEQRIDFARLRQERLDRAKAALEASDLGAVLLFDPNNIRYVTSTHIGEWARDKNARFALLPRGDDPILWDFGSAARHHQLFAPWLPPENFRAGVAPMRGAMPVETGIPDRLGERIATSSATRPRRRAARRRHGGPRHDRGAPASRRPRHRRLAGDARGAEDQDGAGDRAARPVGGARRRGLRGDLPDAATRRVRARDRRARAPAAVRDGLGAGRGGQRCLRRPLQPAPPRLLGQAPATGDQAFFDIIHSFMGYRTCYYRTFNVGGVNHAQLDAYKQCREWLDSAIALVRPGMTTDRIAEVWPTAEELGFPDEETCFGLQFGHGIGVGLYESPMISAFIPSTPHRAGGGHGLCARDVLRGDRRSLRRTDRGGGRGDGDRLRVLTRFPAEELLVAGRIYVRGADLVGGTATPPIGAPALRPRSHRPPWSSPPACPVSNATGTRTLPTACRRTASCAGRTSAGDALPGRSGGLTSCRLVDGSLGSTHMALTLVSLEVATSTSTCTRSRRASTSWRETRCCTSKGGA